MLAQRTPRFGNDVAEVDALVNRINAVHAEFCWNHVDSRNGRYTCGVWPVDQHVGAGHWTAATPDGRHAARRWWTAWAPARAPTATAPPRCCTRWPGSTTSSTGRRATPATSNSPPRSAAPDGLEQLRDLTTTFMRLGGQELQINVVDADTLRAAKADPRAYQDLIVRVAGFSAYFTQLSPDVQDEIISRTEQEI